MLRVMSVDLFAMKLKICRDLPTKGSFSSERKKLLEDFEGFKCDDIGLSQLADSKHRVTFIRGIAGMGKSVLAKQLAFGWAKNRIYTDFKMLIMLEYTDLNYFQSKEPWIKTHEIVPKFLKSMTDYDFNDAEGVLFVVDGLDELYDINTNKSIIGQLLNRKITKYVKAKVIITGRPHVEDKLEGYGKEIGGLRKLEILGLSSGQIERYIHDFGSTHNKVLDRKMAMDTSKRFLAILHVPQFLNTFCCAAGLMEGKQFLTLLKYIAGQFIYF